MTEQKVEDYKVGEIYALKDLLTENKRRYFKIHVNLYDRITDPFRIERLKELIELCNQYKIQQEISFNANLHNGVFIQIEEYVLYQQVINNLTDYLGNWGDAKGFLLALEDKFRNYTLYIDDGCYYFEMVRPVTPNHVYFLQDIYVQCKEMGDA